MAANLVSAGDSIHEGDWLGAVLSIGGEVPALGEFATAAKIARAAYKLRKAEKAASEAKTFITYIIKNEQKEVVYVGKSTGHGTAEEVLHERMRDDRHSHFFPKQGDVPEVIATQGNKLANQGAEDVWWEYYKTQGAKLRNIDPPCSMKKYKLPGTRRKIQAYSDDLRRP